jgi:hypothetical protein
MSRLACCCFHKFAHHVVGARAALSPEHVEAPNEFSFLEGDRHQTAKGEIRNYRRFNLASAREGGGKRGSGAVEASPVCVAVSQKYLYLTVQFISRRIGVVPIPVLDSKEHDA